ncbi:sensor histidine kinase [Pseudoalteromonas fenneropenaei]|uniref:Sensor histidine kinase n=1 Tax=Pseudoalteromonas fenneropenaei TaxID=1737459 RepID=A0ABV7CNY3_9GAMM
MKSDNPRSQLFWLFQICGWVVYAILTELMIKVPSDEPWAIHIPHLIIDTSCGFLITLSLRKVFTYLSFVELKLKVALHILIVIFATLIWTQIKWITLQWFYGNFWLSMTWFDFGTWTSASLTMLSTWTAFYYGIKIYLDNLEQTQKVAEATHLAKESQLKMLRYQLNPHFMFNSINAICTLILKKESLEAVKMLEKLCDLLRHSLYTDPLEKVSVKEEIGILSTYLDIEKCRFADKLVVDISVENGCDELLIPSMLIQPLVENALKHGMRSGKVMQVAVAVEKSKSALKITVSDSGKGFDNSNTHKRGIGLANCEQRLKLMYGKSHRIEKGNLNEGGAWVCITLPISG